MPWWTTVVSMRERGGVLSTDRTLSSRHEQQSARTAPSTTIAGTVAYSGFEIAARANTRTSSVRFTTAAPVATTFRYVAVSRNGLRTIESSLHSTPIGAQLIVRCEPPDTVVTIVSMITADPRGSPDQLDRRRHEGSRGTPTRLRARVRAVGAGRQRTCARAGNEAIEDPIAVLGGGRLRMKLHADHGIRPVLDRHDLAVVPGKRERAQ